MVMFFKNKELFFVNEYLRSVLSIDNLDSDHVIAILSQMLQLEDTSHQAVLEFLSENTSLIYENNVYQIEHEHIDELDIFVVVRITAATVSLLDQTHAIRMMREKTFLETPERSIEIKELLIKVLGAWNDGQTHESLVLYKGIPIKGQCEIVTLEQETIKVLVEKKQLIAANPGTQWLIGSKKNLLLSGRVEGHDLNRQQVTIGSLCLVERGFNRRTLIRYEADENDRLYITVDGKKKGIAIRDVSEKGIAVHTADEALLANISGPKILPARMQLAGKDIQVTVKWLYSIPVEGGMFKAAFTMEYDAHNGMILKDWMTHKQLQLIKEIQNFVRMVPSLDTNHEHGWVI